MTDIVDTRTTLEKAQDFAIGQVLSEWDSSLDYDGILELLRSDAFESGDDDAWERAVPWYPYEDFNGFSIADTIESMVSDLMYLFGDKAQD